MALSILPYLYPALALITVLVVIELYLRRWKTDEDGLLAVLTQSQATVKMALSDARGDAVYVDELRDMIRRITRETLVLAAYSEGVVVRLFSVAFVFIFVGVRIPGQVDH